MKTRTGAIAAAAFGGLALATAAAGGPNYHLVELGSLGGGESRATAINDKGWVVGASLIDPVGPEHAFVWVNGVMTDVGTLGGWSVARDVNNLGQIVGQSESRSGHPHAFYWLEGVLEDLDNLLYPGLAVPEGVTPPVPWATPVPPVRIETLIDATGINDDGSILLVGRLHGSKELRSFLFVPVGPVPSHTPSFVAYDLGVLPGEPFCCAHGLNGQNCVVGVSGDGAFLCRDQVMKPLDPKVSRSCAYGVNGDGWAVGWWGDSETEPRACLWIAPEVRWDLVSEDGLDCDSAALDLNDDGQIVGWRTRGPGKPPEAMLWAGRHSWVLHDPGLIDHASPLPPIGTVPVTRLEKATGITDDGRIVGEARLADGRPRAFLLIPAEIADDVGVITTVRRRDTIGDR